MKVTPFGFVRCGAALLLAALMLVSGARAEQIVLPSSLTAIEANAFSNDTAVRTVKIPSGTASIGSQAFSNCSNLGWVTIPASVTSIGSGAFSGCASDLLITTTSGSTAANYARNNKFDYQAGTKYRALLIGQEYVSWGSERLPGPFNNVAAMNAGLTRFSGTPYSVTIRKDLTAQGIIDAIPSAFGGATVNDVSLFYYSGHGFGPAGMSYTGALAGTDRDGVTATQLRAALDQIPGRKIVILDSCYSGNMISRGGKIAKSDTPVGSPEEFVDSFISAFQGKTKAGLGGDSYFVLAAASATQTSSGVSLDGMRTYRGVFTMCFLAGCGYSYGLNATGLHADANGNGVLTVNELFQYVSREVISYIDWLRTHYTNLADMKYQYTQVYPTNCNWFGMLRS